MSYNYNDLTHTEILDTLRQWRENNERPNMELLYMFEAIMKHLPKMGNEKYVIMEQLIYAALDGHCVDGTGKLTIMMLSDEFPDSLRVMIFKAMCFEAKEQYDEALEILDSVIKMDETNALARKRRVAILKAQGLINEAIKELVDYLKKFMSDMEAWQELSEFYLQVQEYSKAAFCVEELILHQPHNHLMHQRYADIRYTMGGVDNMELAKSYYCQALKLNPDNMRALLGLFLVTNNLLTLYKSSGSSKRKEIFKLSQWAQSEAIKRQKKVQPSAAVPALSNLMLSLAIAD